MQGKTRTTKTDDLAFIFFKIRETRCIKTRRSWQRRARLSLAKREDLTPAERHEVCAVWSKRNVHQIDSPALSKLQGLEHRPQPHQTIKASTCTRRRFDAPSVRYCSAARISPALESVPQHPESCKLQRVAFRASLILFQGYIYQRLPRGNGVPCPLNDSPERQHRRRGLSPEMHRAQKPQQARKFCKSSSNLLKSYQSNVYEMRREKRLTSTYGFLE